MPIYEVRENGLTLLNQISFEMERLSEQRSALISAAGTGKIALRGLAAEQTEAA